MLRVFYNRPFTDMMVVDEKEKYHHIAIVLRSKVGDEVYLVNDKTIAQTKITGITKTEIHLQLVAEYDEDNELAANVTLGFGPLKGDNTQLVVQKAVELGAKHIDLINFKRNVSKFDSDKAKKKISKFEKIIEGACLQSRRNVLPTIEANIKLTNDYLQGFDLVLVCYENEQANHLNHYQSQLLNAKNILLLIGPEGGIDDTEIEFLSQQENVKIATLGKRILRAETASISGLAMIGSILEGR